MFEIVVIHGGHCPSSVFLPRSEYLTEEGYIDGVKIANYFKEQRRERVLYYMEKGMHIPPDRIICPRLNSIGARVVSLDWVPPRPNYSPFNYKSYYCGENSEEVIYSTRFIQDYINGKT